MSKRINRRQFLRDGAASLAVGSLLAACSSDSDTAPSTRAVHDRRRTDHLSVADDVGRADDQPQHVDG